LASHHLTYKEERDDFQYQWSSIICDMLSITTKMLQILHLQWKSMSKDMALEKKKH